MDWWSLVFAPSILFAMNFLFGKVLCGNALCENVCCRGAFTCLCGKVGYMCKLNGNLLLLRRALDDLLAIRGDVLTRVEDGEINGEQRLDIVAKWLSQVQAIETDTNQLIDEACGPDASSQDAATVHQRLSTSSCWSTDNILNCSLGEEVFKKLDEVRNLSSIKFELVTQKSPLPVVVKRNIPQTFGLIDSKLASTWESLMKEETKILGIYGVGGIGKTTLLALINNNFVGVEGDFDVVIWVKVSNDADDADVGNIQDDNEKYQVIIKKIQDTIGERFRIRDEDWSTYTRAQKADKIGRLLTYTKPRFVLLLDDLWKEVSLSDIGIPVTGKQYKVVFTTRIRDVCGRMEANEDIKVDFLEPEDAWGLFELKARGGRLNDEISVIAKQIAAKCGCLPLALVVFGKTMASKKTVSNWRRALKNLDDMIGTDQEMIPALKLSYDYLKDPTAKLCFQYCALFPKTYYIKQDKLVEYWIVERIIEVRHGRDKAMNRVKAMDRGYDIIDTLVGAGLLLKDEESEQEAYMHDMIRAMALRIVSSKDGERYVVQAGAGLSQLPDVADWKTVTKMSLMNNQIGGIPDDPDFPDKAPLITLFLQNNKLVDIVGKFFQLLSTLVVLDLSHNLDITKLPEEISMLVALRYLSLLGTMIKDLPSGLGQLTQLIHLDLESTSDLRSISLISGLSKLQVLRFYDSAAALDISLLKNLERLEGLQLLTLTVREEDVLVTFLGSKLAGKTQGLYLQELNVSAASLTGIGALDSLSKLGMTKCNIIDSGIEWEGKTWFKRLSAVLLLSCIHLKDLSWLTYAANLESLHVESSPMMEVLIMNKEGAVGVNVMPFQNLQALRLHYLDELRSINWSREAFPKLKLNEVRIENCEKLQECPQDSTSLEN